MSYRLLASQMTKLEKLVMCMIHVEMMTVNETAKILTVPVTTVKRILWDVTDRLMK